MRCNKTKFVALTLAALLLIGGMSFPASGRAGRPVASVSAMQNEINGIRDQMADLERQRENLEGQVANARDEREREIVVRNSIDDQIRITRSEIDLLEDLIDQLEKDIEYQISLIEEKQAEVDANHALFLARTRARFIQDDTSTLGLVLGADSFVSALTRTNTMVRIGEHDQRIGRQLMVQRRELEAQKAALNARLDEQEDARRRTEEQRQLLSNQLASANMRIQNIDQMEREFLANLEENRRMRDQMQAEIEELIRRIQWSQNPYIGGDMAWPVPGFTRITSEFGPRFGGADFHTGIDIAGGGGAGSIHGAPVVAANSGTVAHVNWSHTPGRGYGMFVILDHGGGTSTLYAHLSNITVTVGQTVVIGQTIGNVGSTGWSTGPHLHFEVRQNGVAQNPRPWIFG